MTTRRPLRSTPALAGCLVLFLALPARAALPTEPAQKALVIGEPTTLSIQPAAITLTGPRARQQVIVTGKYADNSVRDLTAFCEFACEDATLATVERGGFLSPKGKNGASKLVVKVGKQAASVPLTIKDADKKQPVSFRHEVVASLNVGGCNAGACHGTPSGKNGFK